MKAKKWLGRMVSLMLALCMLASFCTISASAAGQNVVYAKNEEELKNALASNTTIMLEGKDYYCGLWLYKLENVTVQGTQGTRLILDNGDNVVVEISNCKNITLRGLVLGHDEYLTWDMGMFACTAGVVSVSSSQDVLIDNCDIFGCGLYGLTAGGSSTSTIKMTNSVIRDCSDYIMSPVRATIVCENCVFSGNGYKPSYKPSVAIHCDFVLFQEDTVANVTFSNCTFSNNHNTEFVDTRHVRPDQFVVTCNNCTFTGNGWDENSNNSTPEKPLEPEPLPIAVPTPSTVLVNGVPITFDAYNIEGANYFKLRDLAYVLNGTEKQFSVEWNPSSIRAISLSSGAPYIPVGGEMSAGTGTSQAVNYSLAHLWLDGEEILFRACNIGGNNYLKLRDIGSALNFGVDWDAATNTVVIDTSKGYTPD